MAQDNPKQTEAVPAAAAKSAAVPTQASSQDTEQQPAHDKADYKRTAEYYADWDFNKDRKISGFETAVALILDHKQPTGNKKTDAQNKKDLVELRETCKDASPFTSVSPSIDIGEALAQAPEKGDFEVPFDPPVYAGEAISPMKTNKRELQAINTAVDRIELPSIPFDMCSALRAVDEHDSPAQTPSKKSGQSGKSASPTKGGHSPK